MQSTKTDSTSPRIGVSFSIKQCRSFELDHLTVLEALINELGIRRFRLMSYWDECEAVQGTYDFTHLDQQISLIEQFQGVVTLCLGVRQPRWPESHWPQWALQLPQEERYQALYKFIETTVIRYKNRAAITTYQLENEALNRGFGMNGDFNRGRLRHEFQLVKRLDPTRRIIMTTSNTWGIPLRAPRPDLFGFTLYKIMYQDGAYRRSRMPNLWYPLRAKIIRLLTGRQSFIHELQAEPWGPTATQDLSIAEQNKSMNVQQLQANIAAGKSTNLYPLDLWGAEWWYWRKTHFNDPNMWDTVSHLIKQDMQ